MNTEVNTFTYTVDSHLDCEIDIPITMQTLSMSMPDQICVIVPVFNEEEILPEFYRRLCALSLPLNIIFVDNASTDRSVDIIAGFKDVQLIRHATNEGYGASLIDGIEYSQNEKIVIIDADCEYPPEALPELIRGLDEHDVIYTSRFLKKKEYDMPFFKILGNRIISGLFNLLFRQHVTDLYTGCKAMNRRVLAGMDLQRKGFEHVLELGVKLARNNVAIHEIHVDFVLRHTGVAKMQHLSETLKYCYLIFHYYLTIR